MKKSLGLIFLLALSQYVFAQKATRLWQTSGMSFPNGFHAFEVEGKLYFNALHPANGFQLYELEGEKLKQVTSFKQELGKKDEPEGLQGAQTSNYAWFENNLFFFALGKGMTSGIYRYDGKFVSLVIPAVQMSNNFVVSDRKLTTHIGQQSGDTVAYYQIAINATHQVRKMDLMMHNLCTELGSYGDYLFGVLDGGLVKLKSNQNQVRAITATYFNEQPVYVSNLTRSSEYLWMYTYADGVARLMTIGKYGANYMDFEGCHFGEGFHWLGKSGYFLTHDADKTQLVEVFSENEKKILFDLPQMTFIDGLVKVRDQVVLSMNREGNSNLVQINGEELIEQEIKYIYDPRCLATDNENLIYLAKEMNTEYLYTSEPVIPPAVRDSLYTAFDFWNEGRSIGYVEAKSLNERGKLRFSIIDGNEGEAFRINGSSGNLIINNADQLRKSGVNLYNLGVRVEDREGGSSLAKIAVKVNYGKPFSKHNLRETLMFFPDFKRAKTLTTNHINNGESVYVYDFNFNLIDVLIVRNGAVVVGNYSPGMYILNVRNNENLYQKIELQ